MSMNVLNRPWTRVPSPIAVTLATVTIGRKLLPPSVDLLKRIARPVPWPFGNHSHATYTALLPPGPAATCEPWTNGTLPQTVSNTVGVPLQVAPPLVDRTYSIDTPRVPVGPGQRGSSVKKSV